MTDKNTEPSKEHLQKLIDYFNKRRFNEVATLGEQILKDFPNNAFVMNMLGLASFNIGKKTDALIWLKKAYEKTPGNLETASNLALILYSEGKYEEAIPIFETIVRTKSDVPEILFNYAIALEKAGFLDKAESTYEKIIKLREDFGPAHYNAGLLMQRTGNTTQAVSYLEKAVALMSDNAEVIAALGSVLKENGDYEKAKEKTLTAISMKEDARFYFNLATIYRDQGDLDSAKEKYHEALRLQNNFPEAYNNLGEISRDEGDSEKAADFFKKALNANASFGRALYNLGILYQDKGEFSEAADSFRESKIEDWKSRVCYCYYKGNNLTKFLSEFETTMSLPHWSPLLASLSAHYSKSYNKADQYNFCSDPLKYVRKQTIAVLADSGSKFRTDLINQLNELEIGSRKQGRLINGVQSAGNLLRRKEDVFRVLAGHILVEIDNYVDEFDKDCEFLRAFPKAPSFQSSWFVKMQNQGHLTSHIHETGWLSGVVYLQIPDNQLDNDGKIQFGIDGDSYPNTDVTYPKKVLDINEGDIVLFPSSVFHQTIPFKSKSERICIAFDISPP